MILTSLSHMISDDEDEDGSLLVKPLLTGDYKMIGSIVRKSTGQLESTDVKQWEFPGQPDISLDWLLRQSFQIQTKDQ